MLRFCPVISTPGPSSYRLTDDQERLRDAVRVLADERIAPRAAEIDRTAEFPWDVKELLAAQDVLDVRRLGEATVKGKTRPIVVYELRGIRGAAARQPVPATLTNEPARAY